MEWTEGNGYAYGYRKLTVLLCAKPIKKKVYRLCKQLGILRPQRKISSAYPRKLARNRIITGSNELFETDINTRTAFSLFSAAWTCMIVR